MTKTTEIRRSKPMSLFMYVMSLTCDFGAFDEDIVVYLTIWTLSAIESSSLFSFSMEYLGCVSGGRRNLETFWCSALSYLYGGHLLFVDKDWRKSEIMASHHFWIWRRVSPSRVKNDRFLVNWDAWEWKSGDFRRGHLIISAGGWSL